MSYLAIGVRALCAAAILIGTAAPDLAQSAGSRSKRPGKRPAKTAKPASPWPTFEARHAEWVRRMETAAQTGTAGPDALTQYLVGDVVVTGVFETDTGYGVFLFATPTRTTFFASPGAALYNGRLAEIIPGSSGFVEDTEVVFVERSGKAGAERRVVKRVEAAPNPQAPPSDDDSGPGVAGGSA